MCIFIKKIFARVLNEIVRVRVSGGPESVLVARGLVKDRGAASCQKEGTRQPGSPSSCKQNILFAQ